MRDGMQPPKTTHLSKRRALRPPDALGGHPIHNELRKRGITIKHNGAADEPPLGLPFAPVLTIIEIRRTGIGHTSCILAQRPGMGVMLNTQGEPRDGSTHTGLPLPPRPRRRHRLKQSSTKLFRTVARPRPPKGKPPRTSPIQSNLLRSDSRPLPAPVLRRRAGYAPCPEPCRKEKPKNTGTRSSTPAALAPPCCYQLPEVYVDPMTEVYEASAMKPFQLRDVLDHYWRGCSGEFVCARCG